MTEKNERARQLLTPGKTKSAPRDRTIIVYRVQL